MFDLLLRNGLVADGLGGQPVLNDVAVTGGKIVAVGSLQTTQALQVVDLTGLVLAPGFIDIHTHADVALLNSPTHLPKIMQGVTTEVFSNCGLGFAPCTAESLPALRSYFGGLFGPCEDRFLNFHSVAELLACYEERGIGTNVAYLVPHSALRAAVLGMEARAAEPAEVRAMLNILVQALDEGAWGMSTGLWYAPMCHADRHELLALCRTAGFFATHQRDYRDNLDAALDETLELARDAGVPVQLSHLALGGRQNWGRAAEVLAKLEDARKGGIDIMFDSYPYCAGSTLIQAALPAWATAGGPDALRLRLRNPADRERMVQELDGGGLPWDKMTLSGASSNQNTRVDGLAFSQIARGRNVSPAAAACAIMMEEDLRACYILHHLDQQDVDTILAHPLQIPGSDGLHLPGKTHPRLYGTYPRILAETVRKQKRISLGEAVRKMTSAPTERLGLKRRGQITVGYAADLTAFSASDVSDTATYQAPVQFPVGIPHVWVNGVAVKFNNQHTGALPGQVLRKGANPRVPHVSV